MRRRANTNHMFRISVKVNNHFGGTGNSENHVLEQVSGQRPLA
jgi:hypothetical protein